MISLEIVAADEIAFELLFELSSGLQRGVDPLPKSNLKEGRKCLHMDDEAWT